MLLHPIVLPQRGWVFGIDAVDFDCSSTTYSTIYPPSYNILEACYGAEDAQRDRWESGLSILLLGLVW
ncbi:hypothetical protein M413DRAFT_33181 [Hebeloma cylindrosporum]|uniref:Uncharacterized protein n=1 Tax=Hebeloma cylindrosporum TaxID=76867 RepID=A0A0C3BR80_HEBCY|nr:hypothetical protein M413DRAFT_33181 [Hebeloma cylindrosporum h7]